MALWYEDPVLTICMALIGACLTIVTVLAVCLILLWYRRSAQRYAYDRLPINWGEPLIKERTLPDVVVDLSVAEIQNDLIRAIQERDQLRGELETARARLVSAERARRRHLATVRRLRSDGYGTRIPSHVPELWTGGRSAGGVPSVQARGER